MVGDVVDGVGIGGGDDVLVVGVGLVGDVVGVGG